MSLLMYWAIPHERHIWHICECWCQWYWWKGEQWCRGQTWFAWGYTSKRTEQGTGPRSLSSTPVLIFPEVTFYCYWESTRKEAGKEKEKPCFCPEVKFSLQVLRTYSSSLPLGLSDLNISAGSWGTLQLRCSLLPGDGREPSIQKGAPWHFRLLSNVTCISLSIVLPAA